MGSKGGYNSPIRTSSLPKVLNLDFFFQDLSVLFQPGFRLFHCRSGCADDAPKPPCVVGFDEVREFMHDDVIYYEHRGLDEAPIETHVMFHPSRAPPVA